MNADRTQKHLISRARALKILAERDQILARAGVLSEADRHFLFAVAGLVSGLGVPSVEAQEARKLIAHEVGRIWRGISFEPAPLTHSKKVSRPSKRSAKRRRPSR